MISDTHLSVIKTSHIFLQHLIQIDNTNNNLNETSNFPFLENRSIFIYKVIC